MVHVVASSFLKLPGPDIHVLYPTVFHMKHCRFVASPFPLDVTGMERLLFHVKHCRR